MLQGSALRSTPDLTLRLRCLTLDGCAGPLAELLPLHLLATFPALEELSLQRCSLRALPPALLQPPHPARALRALRLAHNFLTLEELAQPGCPGLPASLRLLDARHNALAGLPVLGGMEGLAELLLGCNGGMGSGGGGGGGGAFKPPTPPPTRHWT